jgi:peroxiredoxin
MARQLNLGDPFPPYNVQTTDGRTLHLPQDLTGEYAALIFYRGNW